MPIGLRRPDFTPTIQRKHALRGGVRPLTKRLLGEGIRHSGKIGLKQQKNDRFLTSIPLPATTDNTPPYGDGSNPEDLITRVGSSVLQDLQDILKKMKNNGKSPKPLSEDDKRAIHEIFVKMYQENFIKDALEKNALKNPPETFEDVVKLIENLKASVLGAMTLFGILEHDFANRSLKHDARKEGHELLPFAMSKVFNRASEATLKGISDITNPEKLNPDNGLGVALTACRTLAEIFLLDAQAREEQKNELL